MRVSIIAAVLTGLLSITAFGADPIQRTISTTGNAEVYAVPDEVTVTFGIERFDATLDGAKTQNDQAAAQFVDAVKKLGIDEKDIQAAQMNVAIVYEMAGQPIQGIQGYRTTRSYSVKIKDAKMFVELVDTALKNGANRMSGFRYDTTELAKFRDQARAKAIQDAKAKAVSLSNQLGCEPGRPLTITDSSNDASLYTPVQMSYMRGGRGGAGGGGGAGAASSMDETMPMGQLTITANVNVVFELRDIGAH
jgi:uncharacterized protein YggE